MTTESIISNDILMGGISGLVVGFGMGYAIKKAAKLLLKFIMIVAIFWIGSLFYLSSIKVINLNEKALDNLVNQSMNTANSIVSTSQNVAIENGLSALGIPLTSGLAIGFIAGFLKA